MSTLYPSTYTIGIIPKYRYINSLSLSLFLSLSLSVPLPLLPSPKRKRLMITMEELCTRSAWTQLRHSADVTPIYLPLRYSRVCHIGKEGEWEVDVKGLVVLNNDLRRVHTRENRVPTRGCTLKPRETVKSAAKRRK